MDSCDGVSGFEQEWMASSDDMTQSDLKEGGTHIVDLDAESTELLGFQNNSNEELVGDSPNCSSLCAELRQSALANMGIMRR